MNEHKQNTLGELLVKKGVSYMNMGRIVMSLVNLDLDKHALKALGESLVEFTKEQLPEDTGVVSLGAYSDH